MVSAYILILTEVGKAAQVAAAVAEIDGVDAAEDVTGPYDVIVRASAENVDNRGKLVVAQIQVVEGITSVLTCPVVDLQEDRLDDPRDHELGLGTRAVHPPKRPPED